MKKKEPLIKNPSFQSILTSLICIILGLLIGYIVLLLINPAGAGTAIKTILLNFLSRSSHPARMKALGNTLAKTAPLLMCALSICFCYKVGLFNIGAPGQYEAGACIGLYAAIAWHCNWVVCLILAAIAGAVVGAISGALKAYRNVNEVISGIMLNWIMLYLTNMVLSGKHVKEVASPYTMKVSGSSLIPSAGLNALFANNRTVTIAIPLAIIFAILIWMILTKTKFGYELRATGFHRRSACRNRSGVPLSHRISAVVDHSDFGAYDGIQWYRGYIPGRPASDRNDLRVVLHPVHHGRRSAHRQVGISFADL